MPVGLVLLELRIVDGTHLFTDDACHIMHEVSVPCSSQRNGLRKEGCCLCIVPWHPHAMQTFCDKIHVVFVSQPIQGMMARLDPKNEEEDKTFEVIWFMSSQLIPTRRDSRETIIGRSWRKAGFGLAVDAECCLAWWPL